MSLIPYQLDQPDFTPLGNSQDVLFVNYNAASGAATVLGAFGVGAWKSVFIGAYVLGAPAQSYRLDLQWYGGVAGGFPMPTQSIEIGPNGAPTLVCVPVISPNLNVNLVRTSGAGNSTVQVMMFGSQRAPVAATGGNAAPLIASQNLVLPANGTVTVEPSAISTGVATLAVNGDTNNWKAYLQTFTFGSTIAYMEPARFTGGQVRFGLPPLRCLLTIANQAAVVGNMTAFLDIDHHY